MFSWKEEIKEKYYKKIERMLKDEKLECFKVDRTAFTVIKNEKAKIHVVPFHKHDISAHQLKMLKSMPAFTIERDRYTKHKPGAEKQITEVGYFTIDLDKADR